MNKMNKGIQLPNSMRLVFAVLLLFGAVGLGGCISYTTGHTATPVEDGRGEIGGGLGYSGMSRADGEPMQHMPQFEFSGRYGVSESVDVGGETFLLIAEPFAVGAGADVNVALVNSEEFAFSVNPAVTVSPYVTVGGIYGTALVNLLVDAVKTDGFTLTAGLKPGAFYNARFGEDFRAFPALGGTLGAKIWASDTVAFTPWLDVMGSTSSRFYVTGMVGLRYKL